MTFQFDALNRVTNMFDATGTTVYTYTSGGFLYTEDGPFASDTVTNIYTNRLRVGLVLQQPINPACFPALAKLNHCPPAKSLSLWY